MTKASNYLILMAFFITLAIYRIPVMGYNIAIYHIFLGIALFWGILTIFLNRGRLKINRETKIALGIFILFAAYSFLSFLRNVDIMHPESKSMFFAEIIGYIVVLAAPIFIIQRKKFQWFTTAFLASGIFVYLAAFYTLFMWFTQKTYVTGVPFWHTFTHSEHVMQYLQNPSEFMHFPRFTLPFSSPAGTGVFLSLSGIILSAFLLHSVANKRKGALWLILVNVVNFFCLLGTFARASWAIYAVGTLVVIWYFRRHKLISIGHLSTTYLIVAVLLFLVVSLIPLGNQFTQEITRRFNPAYTETSNIGHLRSRMLALHYWTERPFLGLGIGGFWLKPGGGIHTHSTYFTILVNRGLLGLILFLEFLFSLYRLLKKKIRLAWESKDSSMLIYGIGLLGCLLGLLAGHFLYQMDSATVWVYYGLVLAYGNLPIRSAGEGKSEVVS